MIDPTLRAEVEAWIALDPDPITAATLKSWLASDNEGDLKAAFSGFLQFGTAGLRGPIGPGPSRMNRAVVGRTAAGIASYMKARGLSSVVIGRDARHGSESFTQESAEIFSGAGLTVYVLPRPMPTPVLAYAVRHLQVDAGVMITASHNPPEDSGYKVYLGASVDGIHYNASQIISPTDSLISDEIAKMDYVLPRGNSWIDLDDAVLNRYVERTAMIAPEVFPAKVVYTAMHGVGTESVQAVFRAAGYPDPILVLEQSSPDPDFPTVKFPNPEEPGAIDLSIAKAREVDADIVIANDPDADRCAAAINEPGVGWRMLRGDEVGAIFGQYIAEKMAEQLQDKAYANSIVSSSLLRKIAHRHGIAFHETLTGFKWLAKIENLAFGYEEAIGYNVDPTTANDKDGVSAALLLARITGDLKAKGSSVAAYLDQIWSQYGFYRTEQISVRVSDLAKIDAVLESLRTNVPKSIAGISVIKFDDLERPKDGLPPTNGLRFYLENSVRVIIRPSGTEPKVKCYIEVVVPSASKQDRALAEATIARLTPEIHSLLN
jgi:phosphomannomutase